MSHIHAHVTQHRIQTFLLISFILGWIVMFYGIQLEEAENELGEVIIEAATFVPLLGVIIAQKGHMRRRESGIRWALPGKADSKYVFYAWFLPILLSALGAALYFIIIPDNFDPTVHYLTSGGTNHLLFTILRIIIFVPVVGAITGIGGEIGWHSYFIPQLERKYNVYKSMIICGLVWGIWYSPLVIYGHDFGTGYWGAPWTGIITLCVYFILLSMFFTWLHMRTDTIYVPALAHGTFVAVEQFALNFTKNYPVGHILGPSLPGVISMIPLLIFVLILVKNKVFEQHVHHE